MITRACSVFPVHKGMLFPHRGEVEPIGNECIIPTSFFPHSEEIKRTKTASQELKKRASSREEAHFKSRQEITDLVGGRVSEQMKNAHRRSDLLVFFFDGCVCQSLHHRRREACCLLI